ncbi:MAG TPA: hypothetical protein VMM18_15565 [Gemmatimonadaceae bacterium]|nr:hypothetical protein [Gemmatimonadaceae bacterium]
MPHPLPPVPWQITGNHWLSLPCIHPADGALHAIGILHRGARAAVEFAGASDFVAGTGSALARPVLYIDGERRELGAERIAWERAVGWLPTFTCTIDTLVVRGTIFAPFGRDADVPGAVYVIVVENRGEQDVNASLALEGVLGHRQLRIRSIRPFDDTHRATAAGDGMVVLEGSALPGLVALALGADGEARIETGGAAGDASFTIRRDVRVSGGGREQVAFYIAAGPERDGARATGAMMRRRGWRDLLGATRDALQALEQTGGGEGLDHVINRNLLFAYFYGVARALDDAHYYILRSRIPWHGCGITVRDWEALMWTLPAIQLADAPLARELLLRACELHGYAPGRGVNYVDGTLFEPGFSLEGAAAYALAADRYIRETGDDGIVDEPILADTLYVAADDLARRRDKRLPLYATEVGPTGEPVAHPFTLHGNAVVAMALDVFRRTLDEEAAREVEDPEIVRAALLRHFVIERGGKPAFASATDLAGTHAADDDPHASALWLPAYEAVERHDSTWRRTVRGVGAQPDQLALQCARLLGPDGHDVLRWLRRAPLDQGVAAEFVDAEGRALANGGDAALSGLVAWCAWYAVNALGVRP